MIYIFLFGILLVFLYYQNNHIEQTNITYSHSNIPAGLDQFKILHLSDLHNKRFGKDQKKLMRMVIENAPDVIVVTGDLIDGRRTKQQRMGNAIDCISQACKVAPVFFVAGNHEKKCGFYSAIKKELEQQGVHVLENASFFFQHHGQRIKWMGLKDSSFLSPELKGESRKREVERILRDLVFDEPFDFSILLVHRPNQFSLFVDLNIPLIFSGHTHGGQVKVPFMGGLIAPDQGWFPKYCSGLYLKQNTAMFIHRGLGNSLFPFRLWNYPQIAMITLKIEEEGKNDNKYSHL